MDQKTASGQQKTTPVKHDTVKALDASGKVLHEIQVPAGITPDTVIWGSMTYAPQA